MRSPQPTTFEPEYFRTKPLMTAGYSDKRVAFIRSKVKPQSSWLLHLAGDHHQNFETKPLLHGQHMMRCMLTANLAVDRTCFRIDSSTTVVTQERAEEQSNKSRISASPMGRRAVSCIGVPLMQPWRARRKRFLPRILVFVLAS